MRTAPGGWGLGYSRVMEQTHAHMDSRKGAFITNSDQQLSSPVSQKNFPSYPISHFSSVAWLAKQRDRCWAGCWRVYSPSFLPPFTLLGTMHRT